MTKKPMTDSSNHLDKIKKSLSRRNRAEKRFRWYGRMAVFVGLAAVMVLFTDIISKGHGAFRITYVELQVTYDQDMIGVENLTLNDMAAKLTANPLESVTTVTVQIVTLLTGDQEFDSPKTLAAFALGLMLFTVTLLLNIFALHIVKKYREQYD